MSDAPVRTHRVPRDPRELASKLRKPRLTAYRKLSKHGNSWMVAPPRPFLHALGLVGGEMLELVLDDYSRRFYVRPLAHGNRGRARRVVEQPFLEEVL